MGYMLSGGVNTVLNLGKEVRLGRERFFTFYLDLLPSFVLFYGLI